MRCAGKFKFKTPPSLLSDKAKGADGSGSRILANLEAASRRLPINRAGPERRLRLSALARDSGGRLGRAGTCSNAGKTESLACGRAGERR